MSKHHARQVALLLGTVCIAFLCTSSAFGQVAYEPGGCTRDATANSVWNIKAVWTEPSGLWPIYLPWAERELNIQPDPSSTFYNILCGHGFEDALEIERDIDDTSADSNGNVWSSPRPGIRVSWDDGSIAANQWLFGPSWAGDAADIARFPYMLSGDANQAAVGAWAVLLLNNANLQFATWTPDLTTNAVLPGWPSTANPSLSTVMDRQASAPNDFSSFQTQTFVPRHCLQYTYQDVTDPANPVTYGVTVEVPPVIVPRRVPTSNVQVFFDRELTVPYADFVLASAVGTFCRKTVQQFDTASGTWGSATTSACAEPLWDYQFGLGMGPMPGIANTVVLVLDPFTGGVDSGGTADNPDTSTVLQDMTTPVAVAGTDPAVDRVYLTYSIQSSDYVNTPRAPLPATDVTYQIPAMNSLDGTVKLRINKGILGLDPTCTDPNDADPRYPGRPGLNSPILGVYLPGDSTNYFVPGKYADKGNYGEITIDEDRLPAGGIADWTNMSVQVSTWGVDAAWCRFQEYSDVRFARRINYLRQPEWMSGVVTSTTWSASPTGRPPSNASVDAATVTPDLSPTSVHMRAVTGVFLPQIMSGSVRDKTHAVPADTSKVGMVLGVYRLGNQSGTRYDDMNVDPSNPSAITFVSAVYAQQSMFGTPIDSQHISPDNPDDIYRVLYVTIPGVSGDKAVEPWTPGDTTITLADPSVVIPSGTTAVTIAYESANLYDAEDPAIAYDYDPARPLSRLIALTSPLPASATGVRVVYGEGTGLDGYNYYDPNDSSSTFQVGDSQINLKSQGLPDDCTDVRILYGTDSVIETRGTATDTTHVVPPNIWRISRVEGVYGIVEQDATSGNPGTADQNGRKDPSDPAMMTVIPTTPGTIAKVLRVYDDNNKDYYGPVSPTHRYVYGDQVITLDKALPANVTTVHIRYESLANSVIPSDPEMIRRVLGVYAVRDTVRDLDGNGQKVMDASVFDSMHVTPTKPTTIRSVRGVYVTAHQQGVADVADATRYSVTPSDPGIIGRVIGVWVGEEESGDNHFDPDNPETVFKPGDTTIKLSKKLDGTDATAVTIRYETINLAGAGAFSPGDTVIALSTAIPVSTPPISAPPADPVTIRVVYVSNLNYYNVNNPVRVFDPATDTEIMLNSALPATTVDIIVSYAEAWNRYQTLKPRDNDAPDYAPGQTAITLAGTGLPAPSTAAVVEFSGHLFKRSYNPLNYSPDNSGTYDLRPFIPGDTKVRVDKFIPGVELPTKFTGAGALKVCIAYQSDKKVRLGSYTQGGRITPPIPFPMTVSGASLVCPDVYVDYRPLTSVTGPVVAQPPKETLTVSATYTLGRPLSPAVTRLSFYEPDPLPEPIPIATVNGKFSYPSPPGITGIWAEYQRQDPDETGTGHIWVALGGKYNGYIPLYYDRGTPQTGATYRGAVSAGLNLSDVKQQPSCLMNENRSSNTNRLIFDPRGNPMWFAPPLVAWNNGALRTVVDVPATGFGHGLAWASSTVLQNMVVHDSRVMMDPSDMIDHGGVSFLALDPGDNILRLGRDYVTTYPVVGSPDPLVPEPADELSSDATKVDDGSSSSQFVFRCRYFNQDSLPPLPWMHDGDDPWNMTASMASGVVLYLDEKGIGDYQPHFMRAEDPAVTGSGATYIYRVIPHHGIGGGGITPWSDTENTYRSLGVGIYHYFFGCSDDSLRFDPDLGNWFALDYQPSWSEWGDVPLDPSTARQVTDYTEINRPEHRSYSSNGIDPYDASIYVDRSVLVPGAFDHWYPSQTTRLDANFHPRVTCELRMPDLDDLNVAYDDAKYGYGRFFGTLDPYYRATNPLIRSGGSGIPNDPVYNGHLALAETCGATAQTDNVFRILYRQIDNKPPMEIRLFINNAGFRSSGTSPQPSAYNYTSYTMKLSQTLNQGDPTTFAARGLYRSGVWYEYKTKLPPGPHTYYFRANDGEHVVRYPVRPDAINYNVTHMDIWVPTGSPASARGTTAYIDNDYVPGPYVNSPSVLSDASVTPGTGKEGQNFRYRVKYSDPDGQRPYSAFIYIETNSGGEVRRLAMEQETPFFDPSADHAQEFINGVYYVLDTGTIRDLALENGLRRFYFEFTDDWGAYYDLNDTVPGELTRYPQGAGNWVQGPTISGNRTPTLYQGSVNSQDGTANAATLWTYKVTYRDLDNDVPALTKVYLGLLQPDGKTVVWDDGHTMLPSNPADKVYSDGAEFYFQTRLGGADQSGLNESKQYFYAFEAYDGTDWAAYNSSSNDETRSNAAGCFVLDPLLRVDPAHYVIRPLVAQQATVNSTTQITPDKPSDVLKVWGVYLTENLGAGSGVNYLSTGDNPPFYAGGAITLTTPLSGSVAKVWLQYEPQAPIVGPLPIDLPAPSGVIPDALIYNDYTNNPTPILIDDQKNGWINTDINSLDDRGVLRMRGLALSDGDPSVAFVTPDSPRDIASVEGVYIDPEMTGANYYDRSILEPQMIRTATVDTTDPNRRTIIPDDPDKIAYVSGVFADAGFTGTNYFMGTGYPVGSSAGTTSWQDALVVGDGTVWPSNPNEIVNIKGVYRTSSTSGTNYWRLDGRAEQTVRAYDYLAKPVTPADIKTVLGIYTTQDQTGVNYYNYSVPASQLYGVSASIGQSIDTGLTSVQIYYIAQDDSYKWQGASLYAGSVIPNDPRPIKTVIGVYKSCQFDASGKPAGTGTNYAQNSTYANGGIAIPLSEPVLLSALPSDRSMLVIYDAMPFGFGSDDSGPSGFGPYHEYLGVSRDLNAYVNGTVQLGYYPRAVVQKVKDKTFVSLTTAIPGTGATTVYLRCTAKSFKCGDSVIPLTANLPEGTSTVWIKYSDIRYTHQLRGEAEQPSSEAFWAQGKSFYSADGGSASSSEIRWTAATVLDPLTVAPPDGNAISSVNGVYLTMDTSGVDYYVTTATPFGEGDTVIQLATVLPAGVSQVYVNYSPRNVHIRNNQLDDTGLLSDVTSGVIGVWASTARDGVNFFDPRAGTRHDEDVNHLRLTTNAPEGTNFLWARYYQRGDYHIDRWNRDVFFVPGKEKEESAEIKASYFFGTKMPQILVANTPPTLTQGKVNKLRGGRSDQYIFSVIYRDLDGPNGQAPVYIRVYVDGNAYDMTAVNQGTPAYREGATFTASVSGGLAGGSHKFHFEASDGASVALYDWYDENSQVRPTTGETVRDIDGPWVNNPPTLTEQSVSPNDAVGINPWDSVDYVATYTDVDNDEPYFWDPVRDVNDVDSNSNGILDGEEWSGAPRLWVDSVGVDEVVVGTVDLLEDDPMEIGKKRTIVALGAPGWTADEFAGKLLQVTNGTIAGRVYLIQSNTDSTLTIATDDLAGDGVKTSADATPSEFTINGLLMSKENATQQDFTAGVNYKLTVPKLAVGDHKFHITARSRETKPQWLLGKLTAAERVPYSVEARAPTNGDTNGPKVISKPPDDNVAPVLGATADTSVYAGPVTQTAAAATLNEVEAINATMFATIRELRGVFLNANDFALTTITDDDASNYYNPKTATTVFAPGDTSIALTTPLPATPTATMVQLGLADAASLSTVTPDAADAIGTVLGVFLISDRTLAGTDYFKTVDGGSTGTFTGGKITLGQPLPSGAKSVYISYAVKAGLTWTSTPVAVPVYLKYFATTSKTGANVPAFQASDLATFRVNYSDANNNPPSYHDGVQGYVKVVFNDVNFSKTLQVLNRTGSALDYHNPILFTTEPVNPPEGVHKYHFEASDGYEVTRFPTASGGDITANDYTIKVNYKPVLSVGRVDPSSGQAATTFKFSVTYKDQDGPGANQPQVYVRITRLDGVGQVTASYVRLAMSTTATSPSYTQGVDYGLSLVPSQVVPALAAGQYRAIFEATDGDGQDAESYPAPGAQTQLTFTIRDTNAVPVLSDLTVTPAAGKLNTSFYYKVKYVDADGDYPIGESGQRDELKLIIDKGLSSTRTVVLTKAAGSPTSPTSDDYKAGIYYQNSTAVTGKNLGAGRHTFEVSASDGTANATPISAAGPVLLIPYFENFRAVDGTLGAVAQKIALGITVADVGQEIAFVGEMKFPYAATAQAPAQVTNLTVTVVKPDGTTLSLTGSIADLREDFDDDHVRLGWVADVTASYPIGVDPSLVTGTSLTLTSTGDWTVFIAWPGDAQWDKATTEGQEITISAGGPTRTVAVADPSAPDTSAPLVDMITPPRILGSSDIGRVFGYGLALDMQIVRWDPATSRYFSYGTVGGFPSVLPGQAIWIKPKVTYPAGAVSASALSSGMLTLGNPEAAFNEMANYRLLQPFVRDYDTLDTGAIAPCVINLETGWNQFGTIFFNWRKDGTGSPISPREDLGIPISELSVRRLGVTKSLADAQLAGWVRDYAWRYDAVGHRYVMVDATASGAERTIKAWSGYWIRAFQECELIINPTTTYNGSLAAAAAATVAPASVGHVRVMSSPAGVVDMPPPVPD